MLGRPVSEELQKKAVAELNEVPSRTQEDVDHIREWILKQPHLNARIDDQWLLSFLRGCKFSLQRTKEKLDYFYTARTLLPELFANRDPFLPEIQEVLKSGHMFGVSKPEGTVSPRIFVCDLSPYDFKIAKLETMLRVYFMMADICLMENDESVICGINLWTELKDIPMSMFSQMTPTLVKNMIMILQYAYPLRIKNIYVVNAPTFFETTYNLIKSLMSDKLKKRMYIYSEKNLDKIYEQHPKEHIFDKSLFQESVTWWKEKIESYRDWFLEDEKHRSDEKMRIGVSTMSVDLFGVEGSFRKLNID